jgi:ribosome biogenesis GTPase
MSPASEQLNQFGWDEWFNVKAQEMCLTEHCLARVVAMDRDQLLVINKTGEFRAKLAGRFLYMTEQPSDFPCVGDWVPYCFQNDMRVSIRLESSNHVSLVERCL